MWPVSTNFLRALQASHGVVVKASAFRNGNPIAGASDLLVTGGDVRVDTGSNVRRALTASIASPDGNSATLRTLLDVYGVEIQVWRGVRYPNARVELAPVGRFRVDTVADDIAEPGSLSIEGASREVRVVDDRFTMPRSGSTGLLVTEQIRRLIRESIPGANVVDWTGSFALVPSGVVWERDRWQAVVDLATSIGAIVYADAVGDFQITPVPTLTDRPDWTVAAATPSAVILSGKRSSTRQGVYNSVRAEGQATDGTPPVYAVVEDTDTQSPTYVNGPFGRVTRFYSSPLITTTAQAVTAARSILVKAIGARSSLALDTIVNPALEGGDRIDATIPGGGIQRHIADSFTVPLAVDGAMSLDTRAAQDLPEES